jgi:hypothetical protein
VILPHGVLRSGVPSSPPRPPDRVELGADEDGHIGLRDAHGADPIEQLADAHPAIGLLPVRGEVIERRQRVRLAAAESRRHVEHRRGLGLFARQAAHDFRRKLVRFRVI